MGNIQIGPIAVSVVFLVILVVLAFFAKRQGWINF